MPTGKQRADRSNSVKTKGGSTAQVSKRAVDDAKANKGAFKERPKYKGEVIKNKSGKMSGIKTNDGKYTRTTGPVQRRKAAKALEYDKKRHKADSTAHSATIKRFQNPVQRKKK